MSPSFKSSNAPRPPAFFLSLLLHGAAVAGMFYLPSVPRHDPDRVVGLKLVPAPRSPDRKLIWYGLQEKAPEIDPLQRDSKSWSPRAQRKSPDTLIVVAPKAPQARQTILQAVPEVAPPKDIPSPNLVAVSLPAAQAPPQRRKFVPPPASPAPVPGPPRITEAPPEIASAPIRPDQLRLPAGQPGMAAAARPKPRSFTLPAAPAAGTARPSGPAITEAPPAIPDSAGNANLSVAVLGMDPAKRLEVALPPGSRPGEFSKGPVTGEPSAGRAKGNADVQMPGVRAGGRDTPVVPPPEPVAAPRTVVVEVAVPWFASTVSAPLRPFARTLPAWVEARFARRNVYTLVFPQPAMPMYTGDWVIWFAEKEERPGETPQMRPPVPVRKHTSMGAPNDAGAAAEAYVRLAGVIQKDGRPGGITVLGQTPVHAEAALADFGQWEFRAASRNGGAVDVEVLVEVPYRLPRARPSP